MQFERPAEEKEPSRGLRPANSGGQGLQDLDKALGGPQ